MYFISKTQFQILIKYRFFPLLTLPLILFPKSDLIFFLPSWSVLLSYFLSIKTKENQLLHYSYMTAIIKIFLKKYNFSEDFFLHKISIFIVFCFISKLFKFSLSLYSLWLLLFVLFQGFFFPYVSHYNPKAYYLSLYYRSEWLMSWIPESVLPS